MKTFEAVLVWVLCTVGALSFVLGMFAFFHGAVFKDVSFAVTSAVLIGVAILSVWGGIVVDLHRHGLLTKKS